MLKRLLIAIAVFLALGCVCPAEAAPTVERDRVGSITIKMEYKGKPVPGGFLTLYQVGELSTDEESFVCTESFRDSKLELSTLNSDLAGKFASYAAAHSIKGTLKYLEEGKAEFRNLPVGVYLLVQTSPAPGYEVVQPFLVSVPLTVNGEYEYDVDGSPKVTLRPVTEPPKPYKPRKPPRIPQTGQLKWPVPAMALGGVCLIGAGWAILASDRKRREDA